MVFIDVTREQFRAWLESLDPDVRFDMDQPGGWLPELECECGCPMVEYAAAHIPPGLEADEVSAGFWSAELRFHAQPVARFSFEQAAHSKLSWSTFLHRLMGLQDSPDRAEPLLSPQEVIECLSLISKNAG